MQTIFSNLTLLYYKNPLIKKLAIMLMRNLFFRAGDTDLRRPAGAGQTSKMAQLKLTIMRPQLLKVSREPGHSFSVRRDLVPYINNRWHFHTEVELIHFKNGRGTQFVGDNMKRFNAGDVVLVGANLPNLSIKQLCYESGFNNFL
jgi:hypothetical protein